jgi:predicted membrane channel-forming protein YqfA (hemolysin III family)
VATVQLRPAPLRLGADALLHLEQRLVEFGKGNLYDLVTSAEAWERSALRYGSETLAALEERLRAVKHHNVGDLAAGAGGTLAESMRARAGGVGAWLRRKQASGMAELAHMEEKLAALGTEALHDVESAVARALAVVLDTSWPVARWPLYVFTAGAMFCLLTSSVCHLFGCCAAHLATIMWRFDYAGIAVLSESPPCAYWQRRTPPGTRPASVSCACIAPGGCPTLAVVAAQTGVTPDPVSAAAVCCACVAVVASFYPPVYYGFMCHPGLKLFYLASTTALGLSTLSVTLLQRFQDPSWHAARALLFVALGVWGVVPLMHSSWLNGGVPEVSSAVQLDLLMGAVYLVSGVRV